MVHDGLERVGHRTSRSGPLMSWRQLDEHRPGLSGSASSCRTTLSVMQVETLEQIAERLGWSAERLAEARARTAESRPSNISDSDRARAGALSESVDRTRQALDEAS